MGEGSMALTVSEKSLDHGHTNCVVLMMFRKLEADETHPMIRIFQTIWDAVYYLLDVWECEP